MSGTNVQDTLQDEYTRNARDEDEDAATRVVGKELYQAKCVPLGTTRFVCEKERWYTQVVY